MENNKHMKAFPYIREIESEKEGYKAYVHEEGMDLRDYFASDAMKSFLIHERVMKDLHKDFFLKTISDSSYRIADAMMKARIINE